MTTTPSGPRYLTTDEVADVLRTTPEAIRVRRKRGQPPTGWIKDGRQSLLPAERLEEHLRNRANES